jgi:hypothetical protein
VTPQEQAANELPEKINALMVSVYRGGMLNAVKQLTMLFEEDEKSGVPVSMQRAIIHLRQVAGEAETALPPEQFT